jgi:hypothetical protein
MVMTEEEEAIAAWVLGHVPSGWFSGPPVVEMDQEEILVVGRLPEVDGERSSEPRIRPGGVRQFREATREARVRLAQEAERRFRRRLSWGVEANGERILFTTLSVPVMTRLRLQERRVLDTLVEAGVARSRSDALAWCVRLVGEHQADWIRELREALVRVGEVRRRGPR